MDQKAYVAYMWVRFLLAPGRKTALGEPVDLGELGRVAEKDWQRATPYSPAIKVSGIKFKDERPLLAFVNDLENPGEAPFFW
jgi:hypothetical protein